jgi:hypothetical protein
MWRGSSGEGFLMIRPIGNVQAWLLRRREIVMGRNGMIGCPRPQPRKRYFVTF